MPVFTIGSAVELRDIEIFLTLAEELHFGRTAERLHISTARVSQAIRIQERRLGAKLFERTSRRVELTPLGERLREELSVGYRTIQGAIDFATATGRGIGGLLRVGYTAAWCGTTLIAAADRFTARYPGGEVQIREVQVGDYRQLRAREIELQMSEFPIEEPDLITGPVVFAEPRALVISSNHPVAQQKSLTMEDLAGIQLIDGIGPSQAINSFHFPTHTPSGAPIPRGPAAATWPEVLTLISAGKGACPCSVRAADFYPRPGLSFIPFADAPPIEFGLVWHADGPAARIQAFVDIVLEGLTA
ncbi:LysR family transcriptional regulator [Nocardia cyriacigeorgica]|uniref:LysR family transcriptional regulator n=1 Tax=Nocardia cyriacigeorgica TaxID=135487 RepID=UPI0013D209B2|nr:LysR family transcriptional regulator [Nocardia cyriacigeorgica]NEW25704.1 LysR family transcriptional regulator [Nocardia cyriacigeorgica]